MYRVEGYTGVRDGPIEPEFEWFRPSSLTVVPESYRDHLRQGGLIMRRIGQTEAEVRRIAWPFYCEVCGRHIELDLWGKWVHVDTNGGWGPHQAVYDGLGLTDARDPLA